MVAQPPEPTEAPAPAEEESKEPENPEQPEEEKSQASSGPKPGQVAWSKMKVIDHRLEDDDDDCFDSKSEEEAK